MLQFTDNYKEKLKNTDIVHPKGTSEYTRIYYFDSEIGGYEMLFSDVSGRGFNSTYRASTSIYSAFGDTSNHYSTITEA